VPWIVINGIHTDHIQDQAENDLLSLVCKLYTVRGGVIVVNVLVHTILTRLQGSKPAGCSS
jgi:hypothetical protein